MSFNPLSLSHPSSVDEFIDLTHSPLVSPPAVISRSPSDYIPPPAVAPRRVRALRRCSVCRETGHDARNCPDASAVHYQGQTYNVYPHPRDNLIQFVVSYFVQRVPELFSFPELSQQLYQDVFFHVSMMTWNEVKGALRNPFYVINYAHERLLFCIENRRIARGSQQAPRMTGKDYAKNIELESAPSQKDTEECFICSDNACCVKTACGHEYCADCVSKIIHTNKDKTIAPVCSFCKAPFAKFTVSEPSAFTTLRDFIQNLA